MSLLGHLQDENASLKVQLDSHNSVSDITMYPTMATVHVHTSTLYSPALCACSGARRGPAKASGAVGTECTTRAGEAESVSNDTLTICNHTHNLIA